MTHEPLRGPTTVCLWRQVLPRFPFRALPLLFLSAWAASWTHAQVLSPNGVELTETDRVSAEVVAIPRGGVVGGEDAVPTPTWTKNVAFQVKMRVRPGHPTDSWRHRVPFWNVVKFLKGELEAEHIPMTGIGYATATLGKLRLVGGAGALLGEVTTREGPLAEPTAGTAAGARYIFAERTITLHLYGLTSASAAQEARETLLHHLNTGERRIPQFGGSWWGEYWYAYQVTGPGALPGNPNGPPPGEGESPVYDYWMPGM